MGGRGAIGPVGPEYGLSLEIRKYTVPRHVKAGAVDKFLNFEFGDRQRLESECTRWRGFMEEGRERCEYAATSAQDG